MYIESGQEPRRGKAECTHSFIHSASVYRAPTMCQTLRQVLRTQRGTTVTVPTAGCVCVPEGRQVMNEPGGQDDSRCGRGQKESNEVTREESPVILNGGGSAVRDSLSQEGRLGRDPNRNESTTRGAGEGHSRQRDQQMQRPCYRNCLAC